MAQPPNSLRARGASAFDTGTAGDSRRFRLGRFLPKLWLMNARLRMIFPEPVLRIRFAAPRCVFILGMVLPFLSWNEVLRLCRRGGGRLHGGALVRREDHGHVAP